MGGRSGLVAFGLYFVDTTLKNILGCDSEILGGKKSSKVSIF